jgi:hypothetical protein
MLGYKTNLFNFIKISCIVFYHSTMRRARENTLPGASVNSREGEMEFALELCAVVGAGPLCLYLVIVLYVRLRPRKESENV